LVLLLKAYGLIFGRPQLLSVGFRVCSLDNTKFSFIGQVKLKLCIVYKRHVHVRNFEAKLVATVEKYRLNISAN